MNILFITHKDFETTRMNFEHIKKLPFDKKIYFYNDLYRCEKDAFECELIRKLALDNTDIIRDFFFTERNLGIKYSVPTALDWFFSEIEFGVVVEYDCIISAQGFAFIQKAFSRFSGDSEITSISANNITSFGHTQMVEFIRTLVTPIWGWGSWRTEVEKWRKYTPRFGEDFHRVIRNIGQKNATDWLLRNQLAYKQGKTRTTWSDALINYQLNEGKYSIVPSVNLVQNVGFDIASTNSKPGSVFSNMSVGSFDKFSDQRSIASNFYDQRYYALANSQQKADLFKAKLNLRYILSRIGIK